MLTGSESRDKPVDFRCCESQFSAPSLTIDSEQQSWEHRDVLLSPIRACVEHFFCEQISRDRFAQFLVQIDSLARTVNLLGWRWRVCRAMEGGGGASQYYSRQADVDGGVWRSKQAGRRQADRFVG